MEDVLVFICIVFHECVHVNLFKCMETHDRYVVQPFKCTEHYDFRFDAKMSNYLNV